MKAKSFILGVLLTWLWVLIPFHLFALSIESFVRRPGSTQMPSGNAAYWQALDLEARVIALGWEVGYDHPLTANGINVYGFTDPTRHLVKVDSALSWDARYLVLAHEAGHTLAPSWLSYAEHECFAEATAFLVVGDSRTEHGRYLSGSRWTCLGVYLTDYPSVYTAAALLTR